MRRLPSIDACQRMKSEHRQILQDLFLLAQPPWNTAGSPVVALQDAGKRARAQGLVVLELGMQAQGEARELASVLAAIARQGVREGRAAAPTVILSGGPVCLSGRETGAASFLLMLALALDAHPAIHALAIGGASGGQTPADGQGRGWAGFVAPDTLARAQQQGLQAAPMLASGRAADFFEALGDQIRIERWPAEGAATVVLRAVLLV